MNAHYNIYLMDCCLSLKIKYSYPVSQKWSSAFFFFLFKHISVTGNHIKLATVFHGELFSQWLFFIQNLHIYCQLIYLTFQNWHSGYVCIISTQKLDVTNRCDYIYSDYRCHYNQHIHIKDFFIILQLLGSLHFIEEVVNTFDKLTSYLYFQKCNILHSHVRNRLYTLNA